MFLVLPSELTEKTNGRDKLFRLVQYVSRFSWSVLDRHGKPSLTVEKLKRLEDTLSLTRKLLQFGRTGDFLNSALTTINLQDPVHRVTLTMSRIATALYLFNDNVVWLSRMGLIDADRSKWQKFAYKFWLYSIVMNLLRDLYEINNILVYEARRRRFRSCMERPIQSRPSSLPPELVAIRDWVIAHKKVSVDVLKNTCDLFIPLAALGHVKLSSTSVGFLGTISSAAAILQLIDYSTRLSP